MPRDARPAPLSPSAGPRGQRGKAGPPLPKAARPSPVSPSKAVEGARRARPLGQLDGPATLRPEKAARTALPPLPAAPLRGRPPPVPRVPDRLPPDAGRGGGAAVASPPRLASSRSTASLQSPAPPAGASPPRPVAAGFDRAASFDRQRAEKLLQKQSAELDTIVEKVQVLDAMKVVSGLQHDHKVALGQPFQPPLLPPLPQSMTERLGAARPRDASPGGRGSGASRAPPPPRPLPAGPGARRPEEPRGGREGAPAAAEAPPGVPPPEVLGTAGGEAAGEASPGGGDGGPASEGNDDLDGFRLAGTRPVLTLDGFGLEDLSVPLAAGPNWARTEDMLAAALREGAAEEGGEAPGASGGPAAGPEEGAAAVPTPNTQAAEAVKADFFTWAKEERAAREARLAARGPQHDAAERPPCGPRGAPEEGAHHADGKPGTAAAPEAGPPPQKAAARAGAEPEARRGAEQAGQVPEEVEARRLEQLSAFDRAKAAGADASVRQAYRAQRRAEGQEGALARAKAALGSERWGQEAAEALAAAEGGDRAAEEAAAEEQSLAAEVVAVALLAERGSVVDGEASEAPISEALPETARGWERALEAGRPSPLSHSASGASERRALATPQSRLRLQRGRCCSGVCACSSGVLRAELGPQTPWTPRTQVRLLLGPAYVQPPGQPLPPETPRARLRRLLVGSRRSGALRAGLGQLRPAVAAEPEQALVQQQPPMQQIQQQVQMQQPVEHQLVQSAQVQTQQPVEQQLVQSAPVRTQQPLVQQLVQSAPAVQQLVKQQPTQMQQVQQQASPPTEAAADQARADDVAAAPPPPVGGRSPDPGPGGCAGAPREEAPLEAPAAAGTPPAPCGATPIAAPPGPDGPSEAQAVPAAALRTRARRLLAAARRSGALRAELVRLRPEAFREEQAPAGPPPREPPGRGGAGAEPGGRGRRDNLLVLQQEAARAEQERLRQMGAASRARHPSPPPAQDAAGVAEERAAPRGPTRGAAEEEQGEKEELLAKRAAEAARAEQERLELSFRLRCREDPVEELGLDRPAPAPTPPTESPRLAGDTAGRDAEGDQASVAFPLFQRWEMLHAQPPRASAAPSKDAGEAAGLPPLPAAAVGSDAAGSGAAGAAGDDEHPKEEKEEEAPSGEQLPERVSQSNSCGSARAAREEAALTAARTLLAGAAPPGEQPGARQPGARQLARENSIEEVPGSVHDVHQARTFAKTVLASAVLPAPWGRFTDGMGRYVYVNKQTTDQSWEHPLQKAAKQLEDVCLASLLMPQGQRESWLASWRDRWTQEAEEEYKSWVAAKDEQGQQFYYNERTGESMWPHPAQVVLPGYYMRLEAIKKWKDQDFMSQLGSSSKEPAGGEQAASLAEASPDEGAPRSSAGGAAPAAAAATGGAPAEDAPPATTDGPPAVPTDGPGGTSAASPPKGGLFGRMLRR